MADEISDLKDRLVAAVERGGRRRRFDVQAKRELVQACLQPGISVARMALDHGLNANLLRRWISEYERQQSGAAKTQAVRSDASAFVPVVQIGGAQAVVPDAHRRPARIAAEHAPHCLPSPSRLVAELPNGVTLKLECDGQDASLLSTMIETLVRCHVPARC
jgi:transposase